DVVTVAPPCFKRDSKPCLRCTAELARPLPRRIVVLYCLLPWRFCHFSNPRKSASLSSDSGIASAVLCIASSFCVASQYRFQPGTVAVRLTSFHLGWNEGCLSLSNRSK